LFTLWCVLRAVFKHATGKKIIVASPHAHNWDGTSRDHGWPVSILP
jgi:hypothetical protein